MASAPPAAGAAAWSVEQACEWLQSLSFLFAAYVPQFRAAGVDGARLLALEAGTLAELGVSATDARYIALKVRGRARWTSGVLPLFVVSACACCPANIACLPCAC